MATTSRRQAKRYRDAGMDERDPFAPLVLALHEAKRELDVLEGRIEQPAWDKTPLPADGGAAAIAEFFTQLTAWIIFTCVSDDVDKLNEAGAATAPRTYWTVPKRRSFSSDDGYGRNPCLSLVIQERLNLMKMLFEDYGWSQQSTWPLAILSANPAHHYALSLDYILFNAALQGRGFGGRVLTMLERAMCHSRRIDLLLGHIIHRPFFFLVANRHGWTLVRLPPQWIIESNGETVPNSAPPMFGDDRGAHITAFTYSPEIGVATSLDSYGPHAFWTRPSARILDLATARTGRTMPHLNKPLSKLERYYAKGHNHTALLFKVRFEHETNADIIKHLVAIGNTDPEGRPLACHVTVEGTVEGPGVIFVGWATALLVLLGRTFWRSLYIHLPANRVFSDEDLTRVWDPARPLAPWRLRHLGELPNFEPQPEDALLHRWVPVKRQWYERGGAYRAQIMETAVAPPVPPPPVPPTVEKEEDEPRRKRPRLSHCLHCKTLAAFGPAPSTLFYFCRTGCHDAYYASDEFY